MNGTNEIKYYSAVALYKQRSTGKQKWLLVCQLNVKEALVWIRRWVGRFETI